MHRTLEGTKRSDNVMADINAALARPVEELQRMEAAELRKLAHHAFHGIGAARGVSGPSGYGGSVCVCVCVWGGGDDGVQGVMVRRFVVTQP